MILLDASAPNASVGVRQAETYDRRSFGESVTFEDFTPEARTKGNAKIGWKLFSTANDSAQRAESVTRNTLEVLAQRCWRCQEHRGRICARSLRKLIAIERRRCSDDDSPCGKREEKSHCKTEAVKEWQRGKHDHPLDKPRLGDLEDVGNEISVGKRTPLGSPLLPLVNSRIASASGSVFVLPVILASSEVGKRNAAARCHNRCAGEMFPISLSI